MSAMSDGGGVSAWEFKPPTPHVEVDTSAWGESELVPEIGVCSLSLMISTAAALNPALVPLEAPSANMLLSLITAGDGALLASAAAC